MKCNLCNIYCPSSYQYEQHMSGRKHAERLRGDTSATGRGRGVCFYWEKGACYKGNACTYLHTTIGESSAGKKRDSPYYCEPTSNLITPYKTPEPQDEFVADILLCKGVKDKVKEEDNDPEARLAPIFRAKKKAPKSPEPQSRFPAEYRNVFRRKKNVNLYIREDVGVVFEFAYNTTIIQAVKTQIKGRAWNPQMKCWTCPLESLSDAIALYEHMGREVDPSLQQRAKELTQTLGTAASDAIQMSIQLQVLAKATNDDDDDDDDSVSSSPAATIGSVQVKFLYDADVVASLKKLSPLQRTYDPATKIWTLDVLALPELLEHLQPLGYAPSQELQGVAKSCTNLQTLFDESSLSSKEEESDDTQEQVEAALKELFRLVNAAKNNVTQVDRSGCGEAKRRKLMTSSQRQWARRKSGDWDSDEDSFDDNDYGYDSDELDLDYGYLYRSLRRERDTTPSTADCDCGQPWKRVGGRHVCRYFGTFHCNGCSNQWTSAYCWEGEKQACRRCNRESLPVKKDQLDGRPPIGGGGGHDSARCAMCQRLGYNCSL